MRVTFTEIAWQQYLDWLQEDKKTIKRINTLIKDITRNGPMNGIGKPEALKYQKAYSRRIDEANRLVYFIDSDGELVIQHCKGHYEE